MEDKSITSTINNFSNGIIEVEKMKITKKFIDSERQAQEMMMQGQLQMVALFVDVLKAKDSIKSSK